MFFFSNKSHYCRYDLKADCGSAEAVRRRDQLIKEGEEEDAGSELGRSRQMKINIVKCTKDPGH